MHIVSIRQLISYGRILHTCAKEVLPWIPSLIINKLIGRETVKGGMRNGMEYGTEYRMEHGMEYGMKCIDETLKKDDKACYI